MNEYLEKISANLDIGEYAIVTRLINEHQTAFTYDDADISGEKIKDKYHEITEMEEIKISVVSNMTANVIENPLVHHLFSINKKVDIYVSGVTGYPFEMMNPNSEARKNNPDFNLLVLDDEIIWSKIEDIHDTKLITEEINQFMVTLKSILQDQGLSGQVIAHTIPLSKRHFLKIVDYHTKTEMMKLWRTFNLELIELSLQFSNFQIIDLETIWQGLGQVYDDSFAIYTEMRFTHEVFNLIAKELTGIVTAIKGITKKALIFDLDNTLWKGILGDDGIEGIQMGDNFDGKAFRNLQKLGLAYKNQGILLGICSKNEISNVKQALNEHPEMILREEDFSVIYANWDRKSDNLKQIAKGLNISENSLVFVDDSRFEREEVRTNTEISVVEFPKQMEKMTTILLESNYFHKINLTHEDKNRTEYFKIDKKRNEENVATDGDYTSYLYQLEMKLEVSRDNAAYLNRVVQLEQRTNQFNLTTRRYTNQFISKALKDENWKVFTFELLDKYGSYGCISSILIHIKSDEKQDKVWHIQSFLLSCRVFSRNVENEIIRLILDQAKKDGAIYVLGEYIATKKNEPFKNIYQQNGFEEDNVLNESKLFKHRLEELPDNIAWISSLYKIKNQELVEEV